MNESKATKVVTLTLHGDAVTSELSVMGLPLKQQDVELDRKGLAFLLRTVAWAATNNVKVIIEN